MLRKLQPKAQLQWVSNTIAMDQPSYATMRGKISRHDLKFEVKLWLEFVCAWIMPSKNDQRVHEVALLIACLMMGVHINYEKILSVKIRRKS